MALKMFAERQIYSIWHTVKYNKPKTVFSTEVLIMTAYFSIVYNWCLCNREQVLDDPIEQWQVSGGQFSHVHVFHRHQQDLRTETPGHSHL